MDVNKNMNKNNIKQLTNWEFSFFKINPIDLPQPYGFNISITEVFTFYFIILDC
jgi:hypothetical protein